MNSSIYKLTAAALLLFAGAAQAQQQVAGLYVYPKKGQSEDQQYVDVGQCRSWAKQNTGFDPSEVPQATQPPPSDQSSSVGRGLAGGALLGAAMGAIIDGKDGAGTGALAGGLLGGVRSSSQNRQAEQQNQQWAQQQASQYAQKRSDWNRAFSACMEARDYTVQ